MTVRQLSNRIGWARPASRPHRRARRRLGARDAAITHEVLMGAQDNLTNVLAVMLGVAIGAGRAELVALAGASAAVAEAISMGGVLYSATRAAERAERHELPGGRKRIALRPVGSGLVCFGASLVAGLIPLVPFAVLPLESAIVVSVITSVVALFILGAWTGRIGGAIWWHDGVRLVIVGSAAAIAAAAVGTLLHIE